MVFACGSLPVRIVGGAAHTEPTANVPTATGHTFQLPVFIYYYIVNAHAGSLCVCGKRRRRIYDCRLLLYDDCYMLCIIYRSALMWKFEFFFMFKSDEIIIIICTPHTPTSTPRALWKYIISPDKYPVAVINYRSFTNWDYTYIFLVSSSQINSS